MTSRGNAPQPHWPEEDDGRPGPPIAPPEAAEPYGPRFAWRARLLWAFGAAIQIGAALVVAALILMGSTAGVGPPILVATFVVVGTAFLVTRGALGGQQRWAGTPSLVLAWGLILGGLARALIAFGSNTFLIPLEPLVGIWVLVAVDRPPLRVGLPADWRSAVMVVLVVAVELTNLAPVVPAGVPFIDSLGAGPDALDLNVTIDCPGPDAVWSQTSVDVVWTWRGLDLFASRDDRLTLTVASPAQATMYWDPVTTNLAVADQDTGGQAIAFTVPSAIRAEGLRVDLTQTDSPGSVPFTVTATYSHGGRWEITKTSACTP